MKKLLFNLFLTIFSFTSVYSQESHIDFDGSYSILIESTKMSDISLSQSELEYIYSLRKTNERIIIKIRDIQILLISEIEYSEGIRIIKHTVQN